MSQQTQQDLELRAGVFGVPLEARALEILHRVPVLDELLGDRVANCHSPPLASQ